MEKQQNVNQKSPEEELLAAETSELADETMEEVAAGVVASGGIHVWHNPAL